MTIVFTIDNTQELKERQQQNELDSKKTFENKNAQLFSLTKGILCLQF